MRRIACIRWREQDCKMQIANCKLQIDELTQPIAKFQFSIFNLQSLLERCRRYSPIVGLEPSDSESILLDITGLGHLFGGETALAR